VTVRVRNVGLKGIATVEMSEIGINVIVNDCSNNNLNLERKYRFRFDGIPLYPYESIVPQSLKHNYNLVTFVGWLKVNKATLR
jgi:hypothetical protein